MSSIPTTSSPWLNSGTFSGYQSINPHVPDQRIDDSVEENIEVIIPIPIDESAPPSFNGQGSKVRQWEVQEGEGWRPITIEQFRGGKTELLRNQAISLHSVVKDLKWQARCINVGAMGSNFVALTTLGAMKLEGHIDEHPGYFWGLIADIAFSYLLLSGINITLNQRTDLIEEKAKALPGLAEEESCFIPGLIVLNPLTIVRSRLESTQSTLRNLADELQEFGSAAKSLNIILNSINLAVLTVMASKGYFDEHPTYSWILFVSILLSSIIWGKVSSKFNENANSIKKIADKLPILRKAGFPIYS